MGCQSTKAPTPAAPTAPEAPEADFDPTKTLLTPGSNTEGKKSLSMTTEPGDTDNQEVAESSPHTTPKLDRSARSKELDLEPRCDTQSRTEASEAQPAEADNSAKDSTVPAAGEKAVVDLSSSGEQAVSLTDTAPSADKSTEPSDKKPEIEGQDGQEAKKPEKEASGQEPEIPTGLRTMSDPLAPEASSLVKKDTGEAAAAKAAPDDNNKDDNNVEGSNASVANSTSARKERMMCCC